MQAFGDLLLTPGCKPTPSQYNLHTALDSLLKKFSVIIIRGENNTGKHFAMQTYFKSRNIEPICFELYDYIGKCEKRINGQHLVLFYTQLEKAATELHTNGSQNTKYIYIRHYDRISDILADHTSENKYIVNYIFQRWINKLDQSIKVIVTINGLLPPDSVCAWNLDYTLTHEDNISFLENQHDLTPEIRTEILKINKIVSLGSLLHCLQYTRAMCPVEDFKNTSEFMAIYGIARKKFYTSLIDVEREIVKPESVNLIGLENILQEIKVCVLNPIKYNHPSIPIKKGIVLCGPAGVGKSSIGRWLAYQLNGKLFPIGNDAGITGSSFTELLEQTMNLAYKNAPAVVFIDDVDVICGKEDSYRALLTTLDGLSNKSRVNVCVMVTCMNLARIPSALLRGGRLEMVLRVGKPTKDTIVEILDAGKKRILDALKEINPKVYKIVVRQMERIPSIELAVKFVDHNCADVTRCVDDVLRNLVSASEEDNIVVYELFKYYADQLNDQYMDCDKSGEAIRSIQKDGQPIYFN